MKSAYIISSLVAAVFAGIYFFGSIQRGPPTTETAFYFMHLSIAQAQFYLLAAILLALWGILLDKGSNG
jgi:hypothetical protein